MGTHPYAYALELSFIRGIYNFLLTGTRSRHLAPLNPSFINAPRVFHALPI